MTDLVNISDETTAGPEYILIEPGSYPAREGRFFNRICTFRDVDPILRSASTSQYLAVDFETKGDDYSTHGNPSGGLELVGVGLAWDKGSAYFDWRELYDSSRSKFQDLLLSHQGLLAHNIYFDGGVALTEFGDHPQWYACTYALLSMLHNESILSRWGLKDAMVNILGWSSSNETELDEWLVMNGYYNGNRRINNEHGYLLEEFRAGKLKPNKGEMWRAPKGILGKYCCLDAEATYLLFTQVLLPTLQKFPALESFHRKEFLHLVRTLIHQKLHGILMSREGLQIRRSEIENSIREYSIQYRNHPEVKAHIDEAEDQMFRGHTQKEPAKTKKDGGISKNWIKWNERSAEIRSGLCPEYLFNLQSGPQLRDLYYNKLRFPVRITTEKGEAGVGIKALKHMGETGKILIERMWSAKELSFIDKYLELTEHRATIHPSFRSPGTVTGRLSSKEPNMQQIPKTKAMMGLFLARPGKVFVDLDFSALEPVVATEFSQDKNMLAIYGNGRPSNDIYLFVGANIPGEIGKKIKGTGYDPYDPSPEALKRAKKECKHERSICKTVTLACQYGAGVKKVMQTLENDDIFLDYEDVAQIHATYWQVFAGVKDFSRKLFYEWRNNGGYVLNGMGRPMAVPEDMTQDLLNRFVQSTGHDILVKYVYILTQLLELRGVNWVPIVIDFHDAATVEVPEDEAERTVEVFKEAMHLLNLELNGTIELRGVPTVGYTLADVKEPEE